MIDETGKRFFKDYLIPPGLWRAGSRLFCDCRRHMQSYRVLNSPEVAELLRNRETLGCQEGRRCFVIGNGPSLRRQNLQLLKSEITFVSNGFWKHSVIEYWQPSYYCFADPLIFTGATVMNSFFEQMMRRIKYSQFFVPYDAKNIIESYGLLPADKTRYVKFKGSLGQDELSNLDLTGSMPGVINVIQLAIMAALYMKCSPIYLIGLDHDWLSHRGDDTHFYDGPTVNGYTSNLALGQYSYKHLMQCQLILWNGYEKLRAYADGQGIEIINATDGGFLDVFRRINFSHIF